MLTSTQEQILRVCKEKLELDKIELGEEYYYNSLAFCLIDAIFSIGVTYISTTRTVKNYCEKFKLDRCHKKNAFPNDEHTIRDLIANIKNEDGYGNETVFKNKQRTSTRSGILKAEAVYSAAVLLDSLGINTISDMQKCNGDQLKKIENQFKQIKGQKSGISFSYFMMLSGDENHVKTDRWLNRFIKNATHSEDVSNNDINLLAVSKELGIAPRLLDYAIWSYEREIDNMSRFDVRIKKKMSEKVSSNLTGGLWKGRAYPHIFLDANNNLIDGVFPQKCNIKGNLFHKDKEIKCHTGIASMNSSQALCINFFKKFFEKEEWEGILMKTLKEAGVPLGKEKIKSAAFEYISDTKENTNFDFYMEIDNGICVSMEIKYTESEFGRPDIKKDALKYDKKWNDIYKKMVADSPYLNCDKNTFYSYYQINRNICYAKTGDIVLFISPRANDASGIIKGRKYIDSFKNKRIINLYWEELVGTLMKYVKNEPELCEYYNKFKEKYIDVLQ